MPLIIVTRLVTSNLLLNFQERGGFIKEWDEGIYYFREMGQQPNEFIWDTLLKGSIHDINYTSIVDILYTMYQPANINKFKEGIRDFDENLDCKRNVKVSMNARITLGHMKNTDP